MKESIGYTVTLNIVIVFLVIVFAFLSAAIIYFKSNKVSNVIMYSIEKYEGYNESAIKEIENRMESLGYNKTKISCPKDSKCGSALNSANSSKNGYCVYECQANDYYYYKVKTNMMINIPIINDLLNIPIYSNTNYIYDFEHTLCCSDIGGVWYDGICMSPACTENNYVRGSGGCYKVTEYSRYRNESILHENYQKCLGYGRNNDGTIVPYS